VGVGVATGVGSGVGVGAALDLVVFVLPPQDAISNIKAKITTAETAVRWHLMAPPQKLVFGEKWRANSTKRWVKLNYDKHLRLRD